MAYTPSVATQHIHRLPVTLRQSLFNGGSAPPLPMDIYADTWAWARFKGRQPTSPIFVQSTVPKRVSRQALFILQPVFKLELHINLPPLEACPDNGPSTIPGLAGPAIVAGPVAFRVRSQSPNQGCLGFANVL